MTKTTSVTTKWSHDNASSSNTFKTRDKSSVAPWSELNRDVLFLLFSYDATGVIDFVALSGVCKSCRSFALCNKKRFMASRRPMLVWIPKYPYTKECYLEDFEGNYFKTLLPHCVGIGKECVGLTCGYMVFYGEKTRDFWLINPITRNELYFPAFPGSPGKAILVFSPSIPGSGLVLVELNRSSYRIWFSLEGKGAWNHVSSVNHFLDLHAFKGKIYTLNSYGSLYELRFNPKPKLTLLEIKNLGESHIFRREFVSSGENLYVIQYISEDLFQVQELDFGEMKLVSLEENTIGEYAFFLSIWNHHSVAIKPESWAVDPRSEFKSYDCFCDSTDETQKGRFFKTRMWYFPHLCLDVDLVNE